MGVLQAQFLTGFIVAGVVGFLSSRILINWTGIQLIYKQMFIASPIPEPKELVEDDFWGLGTKPDKSPLNVLGFGCLGIVINVLFSGVWLVVIAGIIVWLVTLSEIPPRAWVGVMYAGIAGVLLNAIRANWKKMSNLYKKIVNPPNPTLTYPEPPNSFLFGAKPAAPAFSVVLNSSIELVGRLILMFVLFGLMYLALSSAYYFMMYDTIWEPEVRAFPT